MKEFSHRIYTRSALKRQKIFDFVLGVVFTVAFALLMAIVAIEWLAGCGESWVQADGTRVVGECVFIPQTLTSDGK